MGRLWCVGAVAVSIAATANAAGQSKYALEYSFDGTTFQSRGEVTVQPRNENSDRSHVTISQPFDADHAARLYDHAVKGGDYFLRVRRTDDPETLAVQSFVSACSYYQSSMSDSIVLYLDDNDRPQSVQVSSTGKCKAIVKKKVCRVPNAPYCPVVPTWHCFGTLTTAPMPLFVIHVQLTPCHDVV
eukprot:m.64126 g.64126  ORF g.64126 m.64126 type:complete len:186 (+) comp8204_c0_seq1:48-605(+)